MNLKINMRNLKLTKNVTCEEKTDAINRIKKILIEFDNTLKEAENIYQEACKKGDLELQNRVKEKIEKIKKEETSLKNMMIAINGISN